MDTASNTGDGRIVIVSSAAHESGVFDPDNLDGQQSFSRFKFYSNSKLYNVSCCCSLLQLLYEPTAVGNDSVRTAEETTECQHHCLLTPSWICE